MSVEGLKVKLTLQQAEQVAWALGAMSDFWCTPDGAHSRDGKEYDESALPFLAPDGTRKTSRLLTLSIVEEINSDLLYRLEVQAQDMASTEGTSEAKGSGKAAMNAALRIRHRSPNLKRLATGGGWI